MMIAKTSHRTEPDQSRAEKRVLMITGRADFGGGPEHVFQLAKAISESATVYIACPREEPYWSRYEAVVGPDRMLEIPHRRLTAGAYQRLYRFVRENGIGLIHAHGRTAGIYARPVAFMRGLRCFYTPHGSTPVTSLRTFVYAAAEYLLSAVTQAVIAVSGNEAQALKRLCAIRGQLEIIPNGVEIPSGNDKPRQCPAGPRRVVHVTRFVYQKNTEMMLKIFSELRHKARLDEFEFIILGDGPGRAQFEASIARLGLKPWVKVLGAVSDPGVYLKEAFCLLSTSRWEGLPIAVLEAMARGVPAIVSNVTGNKDAVLNHETGYLFDLANPAEAVERLLQLSDYPLLWTGMSLAARERAEEEFSVESMASATLKLYARSERKEAEVYRGFSMPMAASLDT